MANSILGQNNAPVGVDNGSINPQMLQQLCDMNCLSLVGANMHAGRIG